MPELLLGPMACQRSTLGVVGAQCSEVYFVRLVLTRLTTFIYLVMYTAASKGENADYARIILREIKMTLACDLIYLGIDMLL